jgi:GNAT superfamily N-acetyltransferase
MVSVELSEPSDLSRSDWVINQDIAAEAFTHSLPYRTQQEIEYLVNSSDPNAYYASHIDPRSEAGRRFNPYQSYSKLRVARAFVDGKLVGWGYAADNTSGSSEFIREIKRISVVKNYLWLRELVVKPEFMRQGIAKEIGRELLTDANERQPVTCYMWPDEDPAFMSEVASRLGFEPTGERQVNLFGPNSEPVRQVRMQAPSAGSVLVKL